MRIGKAYFGIASGGIVRDLGLLNVKIDSQNRVGALAGINAGTVIGSYATGEITGNAGTGGLIGVSSGLVMNSHANALVDSVNGNAGGLVGINTGADSRIVNSYATGAVSGNEYVGGLTGRNYGKIINSYATGNVAGNEYVGGLVSSNVTRSSEIRNSYATGNVAGSSLAGGLVGWMANNSKVTNSYAIGNVRNLDDNFVAGALIDRHQGTANDSKRDVTHSYWNSETAGQSVLCGRQRQNNGATANADHCDRHLCKLGSQRLGFRQLFAVSGAEICSKPQTLRVLELATTTACLIAEG